VLLLHTESSTQNAVAGVEVLHESSQVTLVYLTPAIGTVPIVPQHVFPDGQSAGTLQASGESQARALHAAFGIVSDELKSRQQWSP
jgi:hypothetical protein